MRDLHWAMLRTPVGGSSDGCGVPLLPAFPSPKGMHGTGLISHCCLAEPGAEQGGKLSCVARQRPQLKGTATAQVLLTLTSPSQIAEKTKRCLPSE